MQTRASKGSRLNWTEMDANLVELKGTIQSSAQGYSKLGSGLIVQWGKGSSANSAYQTMYFPTTFPNMCFSVVAGEGNSVGWQDGNVVPGVNTTTAYGTSNWSNSSFVLSARSLVQTAAGLIAIIHGSTSFTFIAVGN